MIKTAPFALSVFISAFFTLLTPAAQAAWPNDQPIKIIVPQAAGGTNDTLARLVGAELSKILGQTVVIDNRPGASGAIGMQATVQAPPDGYTPDRPLSKTALFCYDARPPRRSVLSQDAFCQCLDHRSAPRYGLVQ